MRPQDDLLDTAPCGFLTFSDDGIVQSVNTTLLEILGYQRDDVVGHHIEGLFNVGTRIFYQTHWFPMLRLHGRADEVFLQLRNRPGEALGMLSYAKRRDTADSCYDVVLVHVRERAKYEDELLRAKRAAEDSNRLLEQQASELQRLRTAADNANTAKSNFLAMMSHELRTPLNAIGGYLQILGLGIAGPVTDAQRDILERVEKSSHHLLRLINEVLNLARIEAGHVDYEMKPESLAAIVDDVLPVVEPLLASKGISLTVDIPANLRVHADVEKVSQIVVNLIGNAAKFTPEGGSVRLWADGIAPARVDLHVRDTGIGIPDDKLEAIFQPFVQVDSSRTRTAEGSGLGLAISRDLARGMGGNLTVTSAVGRGSTFTLTLARSN